jgi:hypothetical protein
MSNNTAGLTVSQFHFFSYAIVAENKALSSKLIEVTPIEELPMLDGQLTSDKVDISSAGQKADGSHYATKVKTSTTLQAEWLPMGNSNRLTAPDVQTGERVILYQFGETEKYYWTTLMDDSRFRRLETVIYGISATRDTKGVLTHDNMYYLEVSSHRKIIAIHTSQADGEPFGYDLQINTSEGKIIFTDTSNNRFELFSSEKRVRIKNSDDSTVEVLAGVANIFTNEEINMRTSKYTLTADTAVEKISGELSVNAGVINKKTSIETLDADLVVTGSMEVS